MRVCAAYTVNSSFTCFLFTTKDVYGVESPAASPTHPGVGENFLPNTQHLREEGIGGDTVAQPPTVCSLKYREPLRGPPTNSST